MLEFLIPLPLTLVPKKKVETYEYSFKLKNHLNIIIWNLTTMD
jgi:hypothetical protein